MCSNTKQASGFTLLELIVTISIAGILMAIAIPSFKDMIRNTRLTSYANEFVTSLNIARSEAVKRGEPVSVRKISAAGTTTYWSTSGWNVFVDDGAGTAANKNNGVLDTGEQILRTYDKLPNNFSLVGNGNVFRDRVTYQANGTTNNMGGSFSLCDNSDGNINKKLYTSTSRLIIISTIGRTRIGKDTNDNGILEKDDKTELSTCAAP